MNNILASDVLSHLEIRFQGNEISCQAFAIKLPKDSECAQQIFLDLYCPCRGNALVMNSVLFHLQRN